MSQDTPSEGGRYLRDAATGALTRVADDAPAEVLVSQELTTAADQQSAPTIVADPVAPAADAPAIDAPATDAASANATDSPAAPEPKSRRT